MDKLLCGTASMAVELDSGIGEAKLSGILSSRSTEIIRLRERWALKQDARAQVVCVRGGLLALNESCFDAEACRGSVTPITFVVTADQLGQFRRYCRLSTERGHRRAAFTSHAQARAWAERQAALADYWGQLESQFRHPCAHLQPHA